MKHEHRILVSAGIGSLLIAGIAIALLWLGDYALEVRITLTLVIATIWVGLLVSIHNRVVFPLRTASNMLAALRERDFSMRARGARSDDAMGELMLEVNSLADLLREQRLGAMEASALLRRIMAEIEVAIFAFDDQHHLRMVNRHGERLLGKPVEQLLGSRAIDLALFDCLSGATPRIESITFPGGSGRWEVRRGTFHERGSPQQLLILSDVSRALREQERQAWQQVVRVFRHEVNNSLAPIQSLAQSLAKLLNEPRADDWQQDLLEGLDVIASRSQSLNRFMAAYTKLTRLPSPRHQHVSVAELIRRVVNLESRVKVEIQPGPDLTIHADPDQLEQLLINLIRNAAEASLETHGKVEIGWRLRDAHCEIWIDDEGLGIANSANLFVPFYTTKADGSGIGLALSRQIAEAHEGTLTLQNRSPAPGCRATCTLPLH